MESIIEHDASHILLKIGENTQVELCADGTIHIKANTIIVDGQIQNEQGVSGAGAGPASIITEKKGITVGLNSQASAES